MLKNRHFISYFSTTLIYLAIIGIALFMEEKVRVLEKPSEEKTISVSLSSFVPEILPVTEEPKIEEDPIVKEVPVAKEEPVSKEEPSIKEETTVEPEIIKEPILAEKKVEIEEVPVPEPIVEKVIPKPSVKKAKKKSKVKKKVKKKTKKRKLKKRKSSKRISSHKSKSSKAKKDQFLANIRAKINRHKSYPKIAKKRGMQGSVKVSFTLLRSGKVGHITVSGPKVFHHSARKAVKSAFPVATKNIPISLPLKINITLRYQIR